MPKHSVTADVHIERSVICPKLGSLMSKLDQKRVQDAIDKAYDAEVANLFKILIENLLEVAHGASAGGFTKADQCVGAFARSMKHVAFAYDKACDVARQMATTDAKP